MLLFTLLLLRLLLLPASKEGRGIGTGKGQGQGQGGGLGTHLEELVVVGLGFELARVFDGFFERGGLGDHGDMRVLFLEGCLYWWWFVCFVAGGRES